MGGVIVKGGDPNQSQVGRPALKAPYGTHVPKPTLLEGGVLKGITKGSIMRVIKGGVDYSSYKTIPVHRRLGVCTS